MSKWDKLISKLYKLDSGLRFSELEKILEFFGYQKVETGSSHITFRKEGKSPITIPRHKNIKKIYIRLVQQAVVEEMEAGEYEDN
ncbi:MAG: type II toxin-antitoxin system HicA family toxin [Lachnospiraceae bacterium]|nr:type II toxin-antitoxin system HicA family toxin [Lachnospiraceae bacterium]